MHGLVADDIRGPLSDIALGEQLGLRHMEHESIS